MRSFLSGLVAVAALGCAACATIPSGPSVMVLPGAGKPFEQFVADDGVCRSWALQQVQGVTAGHAIASSSATSAVVGTVVGAAAGAAIGAASGSPGAGAAVGAGGGLLAGSMAGAGAGESSGYEAQRRYDVAYMQCMYAKGNQVPLGGNLVAPMPSSAPPPPPPPPPAMR